MKSLTSSSCAIFLLSIVLCLAVWCNGDTETVAAPMEKAEKEALYTAIQGFVGKWWNGSDLYPDPCGWTPIQDVSCDLFDGLWYVTALSIGPIHDNSLACASNAEFRPQLFQLHHLKSVTFFNCFVSPRNGSTLIPNANWESLAASLESLEFRLNPGLTGQIPPDLGRLNNLRSLVLLENGLTGELPTNLGYLTNLNRLVLARNSFTGQIPYSFGGLSKLLILDLAKNSLSGVLPLAFGGLTSLLKLDLSNNQLEGKIPKELGNMKNLTLLDLSNNKISGGLSQSLQEMSSVEVLILSRNPIGGDLMGFEWNKLGRLIILDLSNTGVTGGVPESISELKRLRFLGLNDNNLTGDLPAKLADLASVNAIYLNGNNLTGELKFSELFYGKMGRRFGVWGNPNLCYPFGLMLTTHAPFGVKPCQKQEVNLYHKVDDDQTSKLGNGNLIHGSHLLPSLGSSSCGIVGLKFLFLLELVKIVLTFSL